MVLAGHYPPACAQHLFPAPEIASGSAVQVETDATRLSNREAARCYRLARGRFDEKLLEIGDEFASRALILGADPLHLPERWHGGIGAIEV